MSSRGQRQHGYALLKIVDAHVLEVDLLRAINVCGIGENADGHARARDGREPGQVTD